MTGTLAHSAKHQLDDFGFGVAALLVERMKLGGERTGVLGIVRQEHTNHVLRVVHAAGGVDARSDLKSDLARAGRAAIEHSRNFQQRAQAGIADLLQAVEAVLDDHAIFARQGNHVGDGSDGHQLQERLQHARQLIGRPIERREQRLHQLERHACAAQVFVGIRGNRAGWDLAPRARAEARRPASDDR